MLTQLLYLLAIRRLKIGVALVLIFLGPLLVALWARFVGKHQVRPRFWAALGLSLVGLVLVVRIWDGFSLDGLGVAFALAGAGAYTFYVLYAEHAVGRRDPISLLCFGFLFATLLWTFVQPWWSLPWHALAHDVSLHGNLAGTAPPRVGARRLDRRPRDSPAVHPRRRLAAASSGDARRDLRDARAGRRGAVAYAWLAETLGAGATRRRRARSGRDRNRTDRA